MPVVGGLYGSGGDCVGAETAVGEVVVVVVTLRHCWMIDFDKGVS